MIEVQLRRNAAALQLTWGAETKLALCFVGNAFKKIRTLDGYMNII